MNRPRVTREQYEGVRGCSSHSIEVEDRTVPGGWYDVEDEPEDRLHVLPVYPGERRHEAELGCWCQPHRSDLDRKIVVHNRVAEA